MLSRDEISRKCDEKNLNGVCDLMTGHSGSCESSNGYPLKVLKRIPCGCAPWRPVGAGSDWHLATCGIAPGPTSLRLA